MEITTGPCISMRSQTDFSIIFLYIRLWRTGKRFGLILYAKHLAGVALVG